MEAALLFLGCPILFYAAGFIFYSSYPLGDEGEGHLQQPSLPHAHRAHVSGEVCSGVL